MYVMDVVRWMLSVGGKIFRVVPSATLLVVLFTLASQICSLLAALLPLKVIILLGSDRIPGYFPALLHDYDRSALILALCTTAVVFFAFHLMAEGLIGKLCAYGARSLIASSRKLTLFENQEQTLSRAYQRFSGALASGVFISVASLGLIAVYPLQVLVVASYIAMAWGALALVHCFSSYFEGRTEQHLIQMIGVLANLGFFITFGCIVADILLGSKVSIFWAIFTLLLVRQVFRRCASLVIDLINLYTKRLQLNALLFHGHVYIGKGRAVGSSTLWSLAEPQAVRTWLPPLIERMMQRPATFLDFQILQTGTADVLQWKVSMRGDASEPTYMVKLFGKSKSAFARHEASLFTAMNQGISPLPLLSLVDEVEGFHCHIFEWPIAKPVDPSMRKIVPVQLLSALFGLRPPSSLVALFSRSRPMLWQRLDDHLLLRLEFYASASGDRIVERWAEVLDEVKARLESMPLAVVTSDLSVDAMEIDQRSDLWASQWGRWTLEPLGAGWPINERSLPLLDAALIQAQRERPDLQHLHVNDVKLAALSFAFDKACQRQHYQTAVELLGPIVAAFETHRS